MAEYFVGTKKECEGLVAKMDLLLGYPNPETKTLTYARVRQHAAKRGVYFVIMKSVHSPIMGRKSTLTEMRAPLTSKERTSTSFEALDLEGAFPKTLPTGITA